MSAITTVNRDFAAAHHDGAIDAAHHDGAIDANHHDGAIDATITMLDSRQSR